MHRNLARAAVVTAVALLLVGCTPAEPESSTSVAPEATEIVATPVEGTCPPALVESISAEVAPTAITEVSTDGALPSGVMLDEAPTCVLSYSVLSGGARQVFYVGADAAIWQELVDAMDAADFPVTAETFGSAPDGIVGATWYRDGNPDRATETTIVNAGWVAGPDVADAPPDAAVLGTSYLVVTVEECPCE